MEYKQCHLASLPLGSVYYLFNPSLSLAITPQYKTEATIQDIIVWIVYNPHMGEYRK